VCIPAWSSVYRDDLAIAERLTEAYRSDIDSIR